MQYTKLTALLLLPLLFLGCSKEQSQEAIDRDAILSYLEDKNLTAEEHPSGIFYIIDNPGGATRPNLNSVVTVNYKGYLLDETIFDQTTGSPIAFQLAGLISGWQIAIPLLGKGGAGTFFLPSRYGYGNRPLSNIPANSVLVFEIELLDFQ